MASREKAGSSAMPAAFEMYQRSSPLAAFIESVKNKNAKKKKSAGFRAFPRFISRSPLGNPAP
jgi:hypothetical protein